MKVWVKLDYSPVACLLCIAVYEYTSGLRLMSNGDLLRAAALGEAHLWVGTKGFFPIAGETGEDCSVVQQCLATQLGQAWQTLCLHLSRYHHGPAYRLPTGTGSSGVPERGRGTLRWRAQCRIPVNPCPILAYSQSAGLGSTPLRRLPALSRSLP